jgi:selenocysteine lyase/cysteine desulfurase
MAALWGRADALAELTGPNHFFIPDGELPYKFEVGGVSHEGCAGILGLAAYLKTLAAVGEQDELNRSAVEQAFAVMEACELPLQHRLVEYLLSRPDVRIIGPRHGGSSRVGTISFVHERLSSRDVTEAVDRSSIAIRHGHMYAYHLCEALGLDPDDGVVRVSLVHYNTPAEIEQLIEVLDRALG